MRRAAASALLRAAARARARSWCAASSITFDVGSGRVAAAVVGGAPRAPSPRAARRAFAAHAALSDPPADPSTVVIPLAQTGEGIKECELMHWFVEEGDFVAEFDPLCTVQSDKASVEVTSRHAGVVVRRAAAVGDIVQVGAPLLEMRLATGGGGAAAAAAPAAKAEAAAVPTPAVAARAPVDASPAVRRVAKELGILLASIAGSGPGGRVVKADVEAAAAAKGGGGAPAAPAPAAPPSSPATTTAIHPLRGYRRAMVAAMQAAAAVPHFHLHAAADAGALFAARAALAADPALAGRKLTLLPFLVKALALTAAAFPDLNAELVENGTAVARHASVHVGVAVDTPAGLAVPVVRDVQARSVPEIAAEVARLAAAAAAGALTPDTRGTITLSNVGALGPAGHATPLLLVPQTCILAVGRAADAAVVGADGGLRVSRRLPLSWGADHRVVDGATLARASAHFEALLADPARLL